MSNTDQTTSATDGQVLTRLGSATKWSDPQDADILTSGEPVMSRDALNSTSIAMTSGVLRFSFFTARKTETINSVRVPPGAVAAGATPTLIRVGIYSVAANGDLALIFSSVSDTSKLASTSSSSSFALSATWSKVAGTRYAVGLLVVTAATAPQVPGQNNMPTTEGAVAPRINGALSSQADLPASSTDVALGSTGSRLYFALVP